MGRTCWRRDSRRPPCCTHCPPPPRPPACQVHLDHDDHNVTTKELLLKSCLMPPITLRWPLRMATEKASRGSNMSATLTARCSRWVDFEGSHLVPPWSAARRSRGEALHRTQPRGAIVPTQNINLVLEHNRPAHRRNDNVTKPGFIDTWCQSEEWLERCSASTVDAPHRRAPPWRAHPSRWSRRWRRSVRGRSPLRSPTWPPSCLAGDPTGWSLHHEFFSSRKRERFLLWKPGS